MENQEIKYLRGLLDEIDPDKYDFRLKWTEDKEIIGVFNKTEDKTISDLYKNETFYRTFLNINEKIHYSLKHAIVHSYSEEVEKDFSMFGNSSEEVMLSFYYIENAIFRTSTLWDVLAQFYNVYCDIGRGVREIHYQRFFKNEFSDVEVEIKENVDNIVQYLEQNDDDSITDRFWEGNHQYIKDYRNQMTHRNAPDEHSLSDIGINLKTHPRLLLRRVIEDYYRAVQFVDEILELIRQKHFEEN